MTIYKIISYVMICIHLTLNIDGNAVSTNYHNLGMYSEHDSRICHHLEALMPSFLTAGKY